MKRWTLLAAGTLVAACSNLDEVDGGVVALEVTAPVPAVVEVNESVQLSARALNRDGDEVTIPIVWSAADTTVAVDPATGIVTGVAPGSAACWPA